MRIAAGVLVGLLALTACDGGGDDKAETKSTTTSTTTTTVVTATTVAPTTTPPPQRCPTAEEAAMSLHDAWANDADEVPGDDARRCASEVAVQALFGASSGPSPTEIYQGCFAEGGPPVTCSYSYEGGAISMKVSGSAANGYVVESVEFIAD